MATVGESLQVTMDAALELIDFDRRGSTSCSHGAVARSRLCTTTSALLFRLSQPPTKVGRGLLTADAASAIEHHMPPAEILQVPVHEARPLCSVRHARIDGSVEVPHLVFECVPHIDQAQVVGRGLSKEVVEFHWGEMCAPLLPDIELRGALKTEAHELRHLLHGEVWEERNASSSA
eukprot:CAMPEP_0180671056 /NCGR_PEP_ID=MMETSP1037_2-20121125/64374_1 /TAXON_ID=632150 /ORGANISM="Azadinium spinosum, Strain 3D9" /LENGTH=176 /DNA_ID=CAMNT_0022700065 /DNA_START=279 /DNA_END=805 /DNA_ORIENTATION=-